MSAAVKRPPMTPALRAALGEDEHTQQTRLMAWAEIAKGQRPELALLFAVPNFAGFHGSEEARLRSGARAKAEGKKAGVPDLVLPVPRRGFGGLYIELKAMDGRPSESQLAWVKALNAAGNRAVVVYGWEAARLEILDYLGAKA